ncbi:MAG: hypothetical protein LH473_06830, partial [Chitinophagales bacterium]|nr:hypothetical protein [Chitinophagales bacterium]
MLSSKHPFTFKKEERLSSKKLIDELFKDGSSFYLQPFKILILEKKFELTFMHAEQVGSLREKAVTSSLLGSAVT